MNAHIDTVVLLTGFIAGIAVGAGSIVLALWTAHRLDVASDRDRGYGGSR